MASLFCFLIFFEINKIYIFTCLFKFAILPEKLRFYVIGIGQFKDLKKNSTDKSLD